MSTWLLPTWPGVAALAIVLMFWTGSASGQQPAGQSSPGSGLDESRLDVETRQWLAEIRRQGSGTTTVINPYESD